MTLLVKRLVISRGLVGWMADRRVRQNQLRNSRFGSFRVVQILQDNYVAIASRDRYVGNVEKRLEEALSSCNVTHICDRDAPATLIEDIFPSDGLNILGSNRIPCGQKSHVILDGDVDREKESWDDAKRQSKPNSIVRYESR